MDNVGVTLGKIMMHPSFIAGFTDAQKGVPISTKRSFMPRHVLLNGRFSAERPDQTLYTYGRHLHAYLSGMGAPEARTHPLKNGQPRIDMLIYFGEALAEKAIC